MFVITSMADLPAHYPTENITKPLLLKECPGRLPDRLLNKMIYQHGFIIGGSNSGTPMTTPLKGFSFVLNDIHRPHTDSTGIVLGAPTEVDGLVLFRQQYARYIVHRCDWDISIKVMETANVTSGDTTAAFSPAANTRFFVAVSPINDGISTTAATNSGFVMSNFPPSGSPEYVHDEAFLDFLDRKLAGGSKTYSQAGTSYNFNFYPVVQHQLMGQKVTKTYGVFDDASGSINLSTRSIGAPAPQAHRFRGHFEPLHVFNDQNMRSADPSDAGALYGTKTWWDHTAPTWGDPVERWFLQLDCYTYPFLFKGSSAPTITPTVIPSCEVAIELTYYVEFFMPYAVQQAQYAADVDEEYKDFEDLSYWDTEAGVAELERLRLALDPLYVSTDYKVGLPELAQMMDDDNKDDEKGTAEVFTKMVMENKTVHDPGTVDTLFDTAVDGLIQAVGVGASGSTTALHIGDRIYANCSVALGEDFDN